MAGRSVLVRLLLAGLCNPLFAFALELTPDIDLGRFRRKPALFARAATGPAAGDNSEDPSTSATTTSARKDNKSMAFLRKIGRVGNNMDFTNVIGHDEGPSGKSAASKPLTKSKLSYRSCSTTGVVDDLTEPFPTTSVGTRWDGFTDRVMGGRSTGSLSREVFDGKTANVLRGHVSLANNGGFVQMAANLVPNAMENDTVDASKYRGIELDIQYVGKEKEETFNLHVKTPACLRPFSSYRSSFRLPSGQWQTIRLSFNSFRGHGPGASEEAFDLSALKRVGVVAIGKEMEVTLALGGVRFY